VMTDNTGHLLLSIENSRARHALWCLSCGGDCVGQQWESSGTAVQLNANCSKGENRETKIYICNVKSFYKAQWLLWPMSQTHKSLAPGRPDD
jgi:hypothetical protein